MTTGEAIDKAGRQRMLSQRIVQSYLLKGINPESKRGEKLLRRCINEFDRNLIALRGSPDAEHVVEELKTVRTIWRPFRALATGEVTKETAQDLVLRSNRLLVASHEVVMKLQQAANQVSAKIINVSGRQRMLSQRMAKNFLAYHWGVSTEDALVALHEDLDEYERMLGYLRESEVNTDAISTDLSRIFDSFQYAKKGFDGDMTLRGDSLVRVITGTTDSMLRNMDKVTKSYAALLK